MEFPDLAFAARTEPLILYWPAPGMPLAQLEFATLEAWTRFVAGMALDPLIPDIVRLKFPRALKLYYLAWIDGDLIKAGELVALTALELALNDRYGQHVPGRPKKKLKAGQAPSLMEEPPQRSFAALLKYVVDGDGLTDADIPMIVRCTASTITIVALSARRCTRSLKRRRVPSRLIKLYSHRRQMGEFHDSGRFNGLLKPAF